MTKERQNVDEFRPRFVLPFIAWLENQGHDNAEYHRRRNAAGSGGQTAGKDAQPALLSDGFLHAFCKGVAKAGQGHGGAGAAPVHQRLVQPQGTEKHTDYHVACQNAGGGQLCLVNENLADGAEDAAAEERFEIFHKNPSRIVSTVSFSHGRGIYAAKRFAPAQQKSPARQSAAGLSVMETYFTFLPSRFCAPDDIARIFGVDLLNRTILPRLGVVLWGMQF